jgi:hypothetical protein
MLSGEPYLLDYLKEFDYNIVNTIVWKEETNTHFPIFHIPKWNKTNLVKGHVDMWEYTKPPKYSITDNMETYAADEAFARLVARAEEANIFTDRHKQRQLLIKERHWKALGGPKGKEKELANERRKRAWDYFMGGDDEFYNEKYIHPLRIAHEENEKNAETLDPEHAPEHAPDPDPDPDPDPGEAAVFIIDFTDSSALTLVDWDKIVAILFATSVGSFSAMFILVLNLIYDKSTGMVVAVTWIPVVLWLIYFGHIA